MHKTVMILFSGAAATVLLAASPAHAETMTFKAQLTAASEVPPTTSKGTGSIEATYNTANKRLSWEGTVNGLTGDATAAHFHGPAEPGKNAGVLIPVPNVKSGPFQGSTTLNDDQAKALTAGRTYFNVHTQANPGGEIRGQVTKAM